MTSTVALNPRPKLIPLAAQSLFLLSLPFSLRPEFYSSARINIGFAERSSPALYDDMIPLVTPPPPPFVFTMIAIPCYAQFPVCAC
jgi:hypothetical protein